MTVFGNKVTETEYLSDNEHFEERTMKFGSIRVFMAVAVISSAMVCCVFSQEKSDVRSKEETTKDWKTNIGKRSVELSELMSGGPPKDGIPAIDKPRFASIGEAQQWLKPNEPVISLKIADEARAYPLQILIWHEIVNDEIKGQPVTVTFCPLCYAAIAFDRRLDGKVYSFGVSGMLRHSDMVMYDRETESWWQQISGEAIAGDLTGKTLRQFPSQIVSFGQFSKAFPRGKVLSRETGHRRDYGNNPYRGYDDITKMPFLYRAKPDERLKPMEKVVTVELNAFTKAYPHAITEKRRVIHDRLGETRIVIFHADGAASALDEQQISESKNVGSTGVFLPVIGDIELTFVYDRDEFVDDQTRSRWNVFGHAVAGKLKGRQLQQISHGDYFAFAWLAFRPKTEIFTDK